MWFKRNYNSVLLVPFSFHATSLDLYPFFELTKWNPEGQNSCYSSLNTLSVHRQNSHSSSHWHLNVSKYTKREKILESLTANSLEGIFSYEHFHKCILKSHRPVPFTNILVLQSGQESIYLCGARTLSVSKWNQHDAFLTCQLRWQRSEALGGTDFPVGETPHDLFPQQASFFLLDVSASFLLSEKITFWARQHTLQGDMHNLGGPVESENAGPSFKHHEF